MWIEHLPSKQRVAGSSPAGGTELGRRILPVAIIDRRISMRSSIVIIVAVGLCLGLTSCTNEGTKWKTIEALQDFAILSIASPQQDVDQKANICQSVIDSLGAFAKEFEGSDRAVIARQAMRTWQLKLMEFRPGPQFLKHG